MTAEPGAGIPISAEEMARIEKAIKALRHEKKCARFVCGDCMLVALALKGASDAREQDVRDLLAAFALLRRTTMGPEDISGRAMYDEAIAIHDRVAAAIRGGSKPEEPR